ncbi:hypothetical protein [Mesorhizobium humile]|uniref:Guanylate cyclase domain-containing protein n=1 Tax=Mesorhizobium humile TaxID=3072313 RepID=A0ABU4YMA3_9HYPH|nr:MULTISPECIES: hypothetical protein [unclassified Mesorhizobium]MDX8461119.1 hypothetical protein [Mesorhizobium sp. VK2D]MDX8486907.1 hypothetical protein [Mesorhizobium sp. VK2B]
MDQERLLAAVLLTDLVGSVPLYERMGDDAALQQVSDCLDAIREIVAQHGGDFIHSKGDDVLSLSRRHATFTISNGKARFIERSSSGTFVSMGPGHEVFVRREDILLFGSGVISPGRRSSLGDAQVLRYEITSS